MDTQIGLSRSQNFVRRLTQSRKGNVKIRDCLRKVAFGMNFAIIGIENQETMDYSIPLRNMLYDVDAYERQATKIRKSVRKNRKGLSTGEYLYGFRKSDRLLPTVTFILYSGSKAWDGPRTLHEILDFKDIPQELMEMVSDYEINLIEIRKLEDTSVFKTDDYYKNMEEDAFDVAVQYTNATELIEAKEFYEKEGVVDMCKALTELIADGRNEGIELTKKVYKLQKLGKSNVEIAKECNIEVSQVEAILE